MASDYLSILQEVESIVPYQSTDLETSYSLATCLAFTTWNTLCSVLICASGRHLGISYVLQRQEVHLACKDIFNSLTCLWIKDILLPWDIVFLKLFFSPLQSGLTWLHELRNNDRLTCFLGYFTQSYLDHLAWVSPRHNTQRVKKQLQRSVFSVSWHLLIRKYLSNGCLTSISL